MPIDYSRPVRTLQTLPGSALWNPEDESLISQAAGAPDLALDVLRSRRADEAGERMFAAQRTGDVPEAQALKGLIGGLEKERSESPIGRQRQQVQDFEAASQEAQAQGFQTPQEFAQYGREQAQAKMEMPLTVAKEQTRGALERQQAQFAGQRELQEQKQKDLQDLYRMLGLGQGAAPDGRPISRIDPNTGAVSFGAQPRPVAQSKIPAGLSTNLQKARAAYGAAPTGMFGTRARDAAKAQLDQAIANIVNAHPGSGFAKQSAQEIASDPDLASMSFEEIAPALAYEDGSPLSQEDQDSIAELLGYMRGERF